jgi:hypothetical protein
MKSQRIIIRPPRKKEPVIWIVDSEQWPRACLRAELIERGYDPYGFIRIGDALDSLSRRGYPKPNGIVLELRGQTITAELLRSVRDLAVPTIVLGGGPELSDPLVFNYKWENVLKRPVSLGAIADLIQKVAPSHW